MIALFGMLVESYEPNQNDLFVFAGLPDLQNKSDQILLRDDNVFCVVLYLKVCQTLNIHISVKSGTLDTRDLERNIKGAKIAVEGMPLFNDHYLISKDKKSFQYIFLPSDQTWYKAKWIIQAFTDIEDQQFQKIQRYCTDRDFFVDHLVEYLNETKSNMEVLLYNLGEHFLDAESDLIKARDKVEEQIKNDHTKHHLDWNHPLEIQKRDKRSKIQGEIEHVFIETIVRRGFVYEDWVQKTFKKFIGYDPLIPSYFARQIVLPHMCKVTYKDVFCFNMRLYRHYLNEKILNSGQVSKTDLKGCMETWINILQHRKDADGLLIRMLEQYSGKSLSNGIHQYVKDARIIDIQWLYVILELLG